VTDVNTNSRLKIQRQPRLLRHTFIFSLLSLLLSGCDSSRNISNRDPFYDYVGKTVELRRPVWVLHRMNPWFGGKGVMSIRRAQYGIIQEWTAWQGRGEFGQYGRVLTALPVGHKVRIDSVRDEIVADEEQIIAYGHTTIPPGTNELSFAYPWGEFWILWRAPWEPDDTPKERGPPGKLPPHWNYDMFYRPDGTPQWGTKIKR
jgi:hypothetical protein